MNTDREVEGETEMQALRKVAETARKVVENDSAGIDVTRGMDLWAAIRALDARRVPHETLCLCPECQGDEIAPPGCVVCERGPIVSRFCAEHNPRPETALHGCTAPVRCSSCDACRRLEGR